ncbi:MAG: hypothetical protein ACI8VZ_001427 [Candidatus Paceibacteria bacterium]|jgi:hypothetical protein
MVTILDYGTYQKEDGTEFCALVVQERVEAVKRLIIHLKKWNIKKVVDYAPTTFFSFEKLCYIKLQIFGFF